jgi:hypothetical protein
MVTPPAVAVMVFDPGTVELKVNVATPFAPVVAASGLAKFPVPLAANVTDTPATGLLVPSRTTTVIVL